MPRHLSLALLLLVLGCNRAETVRFATFNSALSKQQPGELLETMRTKENGQAKAVAEIIQRVRPDVLLLQEFDYHPHHGGECDPDGQTLALFQTNYLSVGQNGAEPITYEHIYLAPSNTGIPTGVDLNKDGIIAPAPGAEVGTDAYAADCHGYGKFPGHYVFVILSKYPIDRENIRTFGEFLWKDLPDNHLPEGYYSEEAKDVLRLSSKNHVDVPITIGDETIHVLASHPTPPAFDGPEDRNGLRNADEILFWQLYLSDGLAAAAPPKEVKVDRRSWFERVNDLFSPTTTTDVVHRAAGRRAVIMGDLNADPEDGEAHAFLSPPDFSYRPIEMLLARTDFTPTSPGGVAAAKRQAGRISRTRPIPPPIPRIGTTTPNAAPATSASITSSPPVTSRCSAAASSGRPRTSRSGAPPSKPSNAPASTGWSGWMSE